MNFLPIKHMKYIASMVSGRLVTNRGAHLLPSAYHGDWLPESKYWGDLLAGQHMSWCVICDSGGSTMHTYNQGTTPVEELLNRGVIPIIREMGKFPHHFTDMAAVEQSVEIFGRYGLTPFWIVRNEPFDDREWDKDWLEKHKPTDDEKWDIIMNVWANAANIIVSREGYVGFPDGPSYQHNPFESIKAYNCQWMFDEGVAFYAGHHYGKNRSWLYPRDPVTRFGTPLTEEMYGYLLDAYADDPQWREEPLSLINAKRDQLQNADATWLEDDTCFQGWQKIVAWSLETFGYVVPMALTEGGWVPRDRPGTGPNTDIRHPHTTPPIVGDKTVQMMNLPSPFFAICSWLIADGEMCLGGDVGWPFDAHVGWAYEAEYGREKPVIADLASAPSVAHPDPEVLPVVVGLEGELRDIAWARGLAVAVIPGTGPCYIAGMFEVEDVGTIDVWCVDEYGLPVEGMGFTCYPLGGGGDVTEYTDSDGLASFGAENRPCRVTPAEGYGDQISFGNRDPDLRSILAMWLMPREPGPEPDPTNCELVLEKLGIIEGLVEYLPAKL